MASPSYSHQTRTPQVIAIDPTGVRVRTIDYLAHPDVPEIAHMQMERVVRQPSARENHLYGLRFAGRLQTEGYAPANTRSVHTLSGRVSLSDSADAGRQQHWYRAAGRLERVWQPDGTTSMASFDVAQRLVAIHETIINGGSACVERIAYGSHRDAPDLRGRATRHDDASGTRYLRHYDLHALPVHDTRRFLRTFDPPDWPADGAIRDAGLEEGEWTTCSRYGPGGELLVLQDVCGHTRMYRFNIAGQVIGVRMRLTGATHEVCLVRNRAYDASGRLISQDLGPTGLRTEYGYDERDGLLRSITARVEGQAPVLDLAYDLDPVGNVVGVADALDSDHPQSMAYDSLYRLVQTDGMESKAARPGPDLPPADPLHASGTVAFRESYRYDADGNLLEKKHTGAYSDVQRMAVSLTSNRSVPLTETDHADPEVAFDKAGNLRELGRERPLTWNPRRQLTTLRLEAPGKGTRVERYGYDHSAMRVRKRVEQDDGTRLLWREIRYHAGVTACHDDASTHPWLVIDEHLSNVRLTPSPTPVLRYALSDRLGSVATELADDGSPVNVERFYPYGGTRLIQEGDEIRLPKRCRFSGEERDSSGLYDFGYRSYAPWLQRWISPDPVGDIEGPNRYAMVRNNPGTRRDHLGLVGVPPVGILPGILPGHRPTITPLLDVQLSSPYSTIPTTHMYSFARDWAASLASSLVKLGAGSLLGLIAIDPLTNTALTVAGAFAGAIPAAVTSASIAGALATSHTYEADGGASGASELARARGQQSKVALMLLAGAVGGGVGAAPSVIGLLFTGPAMQIANAAAVAQLIDTVGGYTREFFSQSLGTGGPRRVWRANPPEVQKLLAGAFSDSMPAAVVGLLDPHFVPLERSLLVSPMEDGAKAMLGSVLRTVWRSETVDLPGEGMRWPSARAVIFGGSLRNTASLTGGLLRQMGELIPGSAGGTVGAIAQGIPSSLRYSVAKLVATGLAEYMPEFQWGTFNIDPGEFASFLRRRSTIPGLVIGGRRPSEVPRGEENALLLIRYAPRDSIQSGSVGLDQRPGSSHGWAGEPPPSVTVIARLETFLKTGRHTLPRVHRPHNHV